MPPYDMIHSHAYVSGARRLAAAFESKLEVLAVLGFSRIDVLPSFHSRRQTFCTPPVVRELRQLRGWAERMYCEPSRVNINGSAFRYVAMRLEQADPCLAAERHWMISRGTIYIRLS